MGRRYPVLCLNKRLHRRGAGFELSGLPSQRKDAELSPCRKGGSMGHEGYQGCLLFLCTTDKMISFF